MTRVGNDSRMNLTVPELVDFGGETGPELRTEVHYYLPDAGKAQVYIQSDPHKFTYFRKPTPPKLGIC